MTAAELIDKLKQYQPETPVVVQNHLGGFLEAHTEEQRVFYAGGGTYGKFCAEHLQGRNNLTAIVMR